MSQLVTALRGKRASHPACFHPVVAVATGKNDQAFGVARISNGLVGKNLLKGVVQSLKHTDTFITAFSRSISNILASPNSKSPLTRNARREHGQNTRRSASVRISSALSAAVMVVSEIYELRVSWVKIGVFQQLVVLLRPADFEAAALPEMHGSCGHTL